MKTWAERAPELAHLLNPAFGALLLRGFVAEFVRKSGREPEFELALFVLPLVLHAPTRNRLPARADQKLHVWLERNQSAKWGFAERFAAMRPYACEAMQFALRASWLDVTDAGTLVSTTKRIKRSNQQFSSETLNCIDAAQFVGKWIAASGDTATTFTMWGVLP